MQHTHLCFSDISMRFGDKQVLVDSELEVRGGSCVLLLGNNGAGKSTLLRIIAGLQAPDSGLVNFGMGKYALKKFRDYLRRTTVYLHQHPYMFDGSVIGNLNFSLDRKLTRRQRKNRVAAAIEWAGLQYIAAHPAKSLSGGERQRVAIARAWLRNPDILLLDEPITNMDQHSRFRTVQLLDSLKQQGVALVVSSHDPGHFRTLTDTMLQIRDGRLHHYEQSDNVTPIHYRKHANEQFSHS